MFPSDMAFRLFPKGPLYPSYSISIEEIGTVIGVGDGICKVYGLTNAVYGELVSFESGNKGIIMDPIQALECYLRSRQTNNQGILFKLLFWQIFIWSPKYHFGAVLIS